MLLLSHLNYLYWLSLDAEQFLGVALLEFPEFTTDHAPLILLPLVAEVLTAVFSITLVTHHTCFRKPVFPEGSAIAPVCGFFLSHRPLSVFLSTTLRSAQISQPQCGREM